MDTKKQTQIKVRYDETSSLFSSQFLINQTDEDVTIGFSSGYLSEPGGQGTILPIHTRISMTRQGVKRLHDLLGKMLAQSSENGTLQDIPEPAKASLPKI